MNIDWASVYQITLAIGVLAGLILSIYNLRPNIRKTESETEKNAADSEESKANAERAKAEAGVFAAQSADILLKSLNERVLFLESENTAKTQEIESLKTGREALKQEHAEENNRLIGKINVLQSEVDELRGGVAVLVAQLEAEKLAPRYRPKPKTGPIGEAKGGPLGTVGAT